MSASTDRKKRQEAISSGVDRKTMAAMEEEKKKRKSRAKWTFGTIVVALLIAVILILNSNLFYTKTAAVTIGDENYSTAQFEYYFKNQYYNFANSYGSYLSMFGLDTDQPLKSQACPMIEDGTWFDYFKDQAITSMTQIKALADYAKENGMELDETDAAAIDEEIAAYQSNAESGGYTKLDNYLAALYGRGTTEAVIRGELERSTLAQKAYDSVRESYSFTDEELEAYYTENKDTYDLFDYDYYLVSAEKVEVTGETAAASATDETATDAEPETAVTEETMAAAKLTADAIAAAAANGSLSEAVAANVTDAVANEQTDVSGSSISGDYADWLKDASRAAGDITVVESADTGYYVVVFNGRSDNHYNLRQVRHILINAEASEDGSYSDEAKQTALTEAQRILDEWKAGEATEESFASLAEEYSGDTGSNTNGGLYDSVYKGQMVTEFNDFVFDPARKAGDTGIVYGEVSGTYAGYHVMYYVGESDVTYSNYIAENQLISTNLSTWQEELIANYSSTTHFSLKFAN